MIRPVAIEGARAAGTPARPLLVLALLATAVPAWAQQPSSTGAATSQATAPPAMPAPADDAGTPPAATPVAPADEATTTTPRSVAAEATEATATEPVPPSEPPSPQAESPASDATSQDGTPAAASTAAESDFDALYGDAPGADAQSAAPAAAYDPWEPYNRRVHRFNNAVDRRVAKPLATTYVKVVPRPLRSGVSNFFSNLGQPASAVNALLQGRPKQAAHSLGRFIINSTLGIGGIFDPATDAKLDNRNEDFGQTLGVWGWKRSRYVELPLFGPRTLRDVVGMAGDAPLSPMRQVQADRIRVPLQGLQLVDLRMQLMSTDAMREGAADDYALVRDAWMQRRAYQIGGDRAADDDVPDYLKDDPNMVPVDAMPVSGDH
jgi:phospholipid-binding lipoprotein MlaA